MGPPTGNGGHSGNSSNIYAKNNEMMTTSTSHAKRQHQQYSNSTFDNNSGLGRGGSDRRCCALCSSSLGEEAIVAMDRLWHPDHFLCNGCKKPIRQTFQVSLFEDMLLIKQILQVISLTALSARVFTS